MSPKPFSIKNVRFAEKDQEILDYANSLENFSGHMKRLLAREIAEIRAGKYIPLDYISIDKNIDVKPITSNINVDKTIERNINIDYTNEDKIEEIKNTGDVEIKKDAVANILSM